MSPLNTNYLRQIFEKLDQIGDGFVSVDEIKWLFERIGVDNTSPNELESLMGKTSLDLLDFVSFYDTAIKHKIDHEGEAGEEEEEDDNLESDLAKAFQVYDSNGDGFISSEELQSLLSKLGMKNGYSNKDCDSMIKKYDTNSDGVLEFEEFKTMILPPPILKS